MRAIRMHALLSIAVATVCLSACGDTGSGPIEISSPDGRTTIRFELDEGVPMYRVSRDGRPLVAASRLGVRFADGASLDSGLVLLGRASSTADLTWTQPWGEVAEVHDRHNELRLELERAEAPLRRMDVVFRAFDDGIGFRYEWPEQPELGDFEITDEVTEFVLATPYEAWWIPAYRRDRYEYLYEKSPVAALDTVHTPLTMEPAGEGGDRPYLSIHESDLTDFASMTLAGRGASGAGATLEVDLVPWSDGVKVRGSAPFESPWRTLQIADSPGELAESTLILDLAEPNRLGDDLSWIRPGKYVGVWWGMHIGQFTWGSGPTHGATTATVRRYIDFAAENGFDGVLVEGWNVGWDGDWLGNGGLFRFTEPYPDFDIEALQAYARDRGVSLIGHHETSGDVVNYESQLEDAFALYERLGIGAVKTGYVEFGRNIDRGDGQLEWHHGQYMVRHYRRVVEAAARHRIMVDVHEPIKDTGIRRTYPNMMTREGARGQEYNSGAGPPNPPEHVPVLAFTRMLAGPFDFTPGIFRLSYPEYRPGHRIPSTLARQLALYVVLYSPLHMAADLVENYEAYEAGLNGARSAFQFIRDVPTDWEYTRVPQGVIGDYVVTVRKDRNGPDWYLGAVTDEEERTTRVALDFLPEGVSFVAEIYEDAPGAAPDADPYDAIRIHDLPVARGDTLDLRMAPEGGVAIRFRPESG